MRKFDEWFSHFDQVFPIMRIMSILKKYTVMLMK